MSEAGLSFIDAHHHLWDLEATQYPWLMARGVRRFFGDPTPIQRNYLPTDFLAESTRYRPISSVHIQVGAADSDIVKETEWLHQQGEFPHAVIPYCDLSAADVESRLGQQLAFDRVRGVRQIVGRHADEDGKHGSTDVIRNPTWLAGLRVLANRGLSFDLQLIPPQVPALLQVLKQVPDLHVALCHCGSPWDQSAAGLVSWRSGLREIAALPNTVCKVSGLGMFNPDWSPGELTPIIRNVIEIFSPARVMFGSNFPVDKLYRSYDVLWDTYLAATAEYTVDERADMFVNNAARFYRIEINQEP